jgi:hypothetical protein
MYRKKICIFTLILMIGLAASVYAQDWTLDIVSSVDLGGGETFERTLTIGMDNSATDSIDSSLNEIELPPFSPNRYMTDTRLMSDAIGTGSLIDIHDTTSADDSFTITTQVHGNYSETYTTPTATLSWADTMLSENWDYVIKYPDGANTAYMNMRSASSLSFAAQLPAHTYLYDVIIMVMPKEIPGGTPPEILTSSIPDTWGKMYYYAEMDYSDADAGDSLTYELVNAPYWMVINEDGDLGGYAPNHSSGSDHTYSFAVKAIDNYGNAALKELSMTVIYNDNRPPVIETNKLPDAVTGTPYSVKLDVDDFRTDDLSYRLIGRKPAWMNINDVGYIFGTPTMDSYGDSIKVTVTVTDQIGYADTVMYYIDVIDFTGVDETPAEFEVSGAFPNPFNPETTIQYQLPAEAYVNLVVYDVLGRKVAVLEDRLMTPGAHSVVWDGRDVNGNMLASGTYIFRLKAGEHTATGKMMFLR